MQTRGYILTALDSQEGPVNNLLKEKAIAALSNWSSLGALLLEFSLQAAALKTNEVQRRVPVPPRERAARLCQMDLAEVAGTSASSSEHGLASYPGSGYEARQGCAPMAAARLIDARSNFDLALESYQDIQLPSSEARLSREGSLIRHLTHPSQIRKR